jgi:hypothetical protein
MEDDILFGGVVVVGFVAAVEDPKSVSRSSIPDEVGWAVVLDGATLIEVDQRQLVPGRSGRQFLGNRIGSGGVIALLERFVTVQHRVYLIVDLEECI